MVCEQILIARWRQWQQAQPHNSFEFDNCFSASRSEVKLKLEVNGFNLEQCAGVYRRASISLGTNILCAGGEEGKDSCSGDSGDLIDSVLFSHQFSNSEIKIYW